METPTPATLERASEQETHELVSPALTIAHQAAAEQAPAEQATVEQATVEQATVEQATVEQATEQQAAAEPVTEEQAAAEHATAEHATAERATAEQPAPAQEPQAQATPETTAETAPETMAEATTVPTPEATTGDDAYVGDEVVALPIADLQPTAEALIVSDDATALPVESAIASAIGVEPDSALHVDGGMLPIDQFVLGAEFAPPDIGDAAVDVEPLQVTGAYEPPPPPSLFAEDLQLPFDTAVAPAQNTGETATKAVGGAPFTKAEVERERQALVDAIVGAVVRATDERSAERDEEIDHHAMRLFAADPFEEPFLRVADSRISDAIPSPFEDDDITPDLSSRSASALAEKPYVAPLQVPPPPPPPAPTGATRPRRATPRAALTTTPVMGVPVARPTPRRVTPVLSSRVITPFTNPVIPYRPPAASVRPPAPVAVSMPTPRSVPAVPDLVGARTVVVALEAVAAQIRAGQLVIGGEVPRGSDHTSHAACLSVALAALLGVRQ